MNIVRTLCNRYSYFPLAIRLPFFRFLFLNLNTIRNALLQILIKTQRATNLKVTCNCTGNLSHPEGMDKWLY